MGIKNIRSAAFQNVFLRLDGAGDVSPAPSGEGTVNCQFGAGPYEAFQFDVTEDGSVTIRSNEFPLVYLRLDGNGVSYGNADGGGVVNGQVNPPGPYEHFLLVPQADGTAAIQSKAFPGLYLRVDGSSVTKFEGAGSGIVNAQIGVGPWEKFHIVDAA
ncbi:MULTISPECIES: fascin domain-containing protein [Rhizobium/Agrobacterium group]|uniref:Uncharacterized protein n=2 Tax=Rhizobium/Agrobacterium group TaxID=227290 RepID=B9JTW7_ALLAM|nr:MULTISPECIES: hypothetical protein [Rhizobium/Agrobacterium group]ACM35895.1 conserved hypothetical protein [Allorhizobium ampelinum S4]MCF1448309.1 hypothetical protein [Allorhizobium ampelinum]MCF1492016.1 hypothetical protein [Allorhizobium ampelinum]MUO30318.1 hypothetical protein [Agrobacterium vitis]MUO44620.1 hypothetical protein [Agrobacterium vitis]